MRNERVLFLTATARDVATVMFNESGIHGKTFTGKIQHYLSRLYLPPIINAAL